MRSACLHNTRHWHSHPSPPHHPVPLFHWQWVRCNCCLSQIRDKMKIEFLRQNNKHQPIDEWQQTTFFSSFLPTNSMKTTKSYQLPMRLVDVLGLDGVQSADGWPKQTTNRQKSKSQCTAFHLSQLIPKNNNGKEWQTSSTIKNMKKMEKKNSRMSRLFDAQRAYCVLP